jgi:DNA polymerase-3 subunit beta
MQFTVSQRALKILMGFLYPVMEKRTSIPILSHILIEANASDQKLTVTATDLDITMQSVIEADVKSGGALCVPGGKLNDIIRLLSADELSFKEDDNKWISLTCGRARYKLGCAERDKFPEIENFGKFQKSAFDVSSKDLARLFRLTRDAITQEQSRFTMSGAKLEIADGLMRVVTTDGHRLYFTEHAFTDKKTKLDVLIPKKAINEIIKLSEVTDNLQLGEDPNHIFVQAGDFKLLARKLNGNFPNYEMVIPDLKNYDKVVFDTAALKEIANRVALMADERTKSMQLVLKSNLLEVRAQSSEEGEGKEEMEVGFQSGSPEPITLGFNGDYLRNCLQVSESIQIELNAERSAKQEPAQSLSNMYFKDQNHQAVFIPEGLNGTSLKIIIMPLRI